jgi:DNA polymerase-3 subunit alpha
VGDGFVTVSIAHRAPALGPTTGSPADRATGPPEAAQAMPGFTHLHVHSEYSLLDGLARVPDLVKTAKKRGFDALALTDHGVMYGAVQFYKAAKKEGIKPIIGCELYVAPRSRFDRDAQFDRKAYHLTVLAENEVGYRNLLKLVSQAQLEGFYYKPRVDREILEKYSEGLIVFSGCAGADAPSKIIHEQLDAAREALGWYSEVFKDRFYVEMMMHDIDFMPRLNRELLGFAKNMNLPLVATNDVHYCTENDPRAHEVLLCIQTGTTMDDPKRMRIGDTFYLRTEEEMRKLFHEMPEAVDNTAGIAERCNVEFVFNDYKLPRFDVPAGETAETYLSKLCEKGLKERYGKITIEAHTRLEYELSIIGQMGFNDYFLIVWDLCRFAAKRGVWWNVRGSGAASIVAYTLRITNIDPLHHNLIFERFLNPSRISMPDIDLDFPDDQRDLLIKYTFQKYGHDKVAQIITFGTMGARAAIRDAGRALGMELFDVDRIAKMIPAVPGKACGIADAMRPPTKDVESEFYTAELVDAYEKSDEARNLLDTAQTLEGVARHASTHAAGVVISDIPLVEYIPLNRPTRGRDDGEVWPVTQFNMNDIDQLGLLKVDFLGLATLTVLRRAAELVERYHGKKYTLDSIPLDDPAIYELLSSGHVTGVFQVEGAGMRKMLREMKPKQFENVIAAIALYRPGPMEYIPTYIQRLHGKEKVKYRHPTLEPILSETYGIIVYQEQIIRIARDLAGYDAGEADTIRKAVSKKILKKPAPSPTASRNRRPTASGKTSRPSRATASIRPMPPTMP